MLRPYQDAGARWLESRAFGILGDEMGLGKTAQYSMAAQRLGAEHVCICAPLATCAGLVREIRAWAGVEAVVLDHNGKVAVPETGWVILPWTSAAKRWRDIARAWDCIDVLILDEAHKCKNPAAQMTKAVLGQWVRGADSWTRTDCLAAIARKVWAITGTPMPNRPIELQPILHMAGGYAWAAYQRYGNAYCRRVNRFCPAGWDYQGAHHLDDLRAKLKAEGCVLRRTPEDVPGELPDLVTQIVPLADIEDQATAMGIDANMILAAVSSGGSVPFEEMSRYRKNMGLAKAETVSKWVDDWRGGSKDPLVLWCWHIEVADLLFDLLSSVGRKCLMATGRQTPEQRAAKVMEFAIGGHDVFIATIGSCGLGLNGLQRATGVCAFAELAWTPGELTQAIGRIRRMDSGSGISQAYLLCGEDTLEHRIYEIVASKLLVNQAVFSA